MKKRRQRGHGFRAYPPPSWNILERLAFRQSIVMIHTLPNSLTRAVFKWLSKVITRLRLLRLVIGLKDSRQFFSQWEAKLKPIAPCTRDFFRVLSKLQVIARNCDWSIAVFNPIVIGRSNPFGFGFSTVIWKLLYSRLNSQSANHHKEHVFWNATPTFDALSKKRFLCYQETELNSVGSAGNKQSRIERKAQHETGTRKRNRMNEWKVERKSE